QLVSMLFDAGASEVHVRISSPPIIGPCFYGIDFAAAEELIASSRTVEEVREEIGATSLAHLSLEGLTEATQRPAASLCRACLTGEYPTSVPETRRLEKLRFEPARTQARLLLLQDSARLGDAARKHVGRADPLDDVKPLWPADLVGDTCHDGDDDEGDDREEELGVPRNG